MPHRPILPRLGFFTSLSVALLGLFAQTAAAGESVPAPAAETPSEDWSFHLQGTEIVQGHPDFNARYRGEHSLRGGETRNTTSLTFFLGRRLWTGAEVYLNPEIVQGSGLSNTFGLAGYPNGEAQRAGSVVPKIYLARVIFRQTIGLGGEKETVEGDANILAGKRDVSRITLTLGRLSVGDFFDGNTYSHDARSQFLNWSLFDTGAYDFPADARGYTEGAAVEWNEKDFTVRLGAFRLPEFANGLSLDQRFFRGMGYVAEYERRFMLGDDHAGRVRLLVYANQSNAASYRSALAQRLPDGTPDLDAGRRYRFKFGVALSAEQEVVKNVGVFLRAGWNNGQSESYAFTEIDRTIALGVNIKGAAWGRKDDTLGVAGVVNGISTAHRAFLGAGGLGILIGDGRLRYGPEQIVETYYSIALRQKVWLTFDYQFVNHPAYNRDRGPVHLPGARVHFEY